MKSQLYIPKKIKVGYQHRQDTYTKKLAYVIYYDAKGVLRKEKSWRGWIHDTARNIGEWDGKQYKTVKQPGIPPDDFENVPTEGFVLNKKAGGYSTGWNHRQTYCRVWDPRGFEFEISIPNLLFILQETSSFKGKGLEGEFVYAWDGTELVLLPTSCEDYQKCEEFTDLQTEKISTKDLVAGSVYMTKRQEKLVYMGKFPWTERKYKRSTVRGVYDYKYVTETTPKYVFQTESGTFTPMSSISNVVKRVTDTCVTDYAERMDKLQKAKGMSKVTGLSSEKKTLVLPPPTNAGTWHHEQNGPFFKLKDGKYTEYQLRSNHEYDYMVQPCVLKKERYSLYPAHTISITDGALEEEYNYTRGGENYTREQIEGMDFRELYVELENGKKVNYKNYQ